MTGHQIALALGEHSIRQIDGLFSLNDLHRASGGEQKHRPKYFIALEQIKELAVEVEKGGITPFSIIKGRNGGTYACRELVIAYAAWISAAFHLKVIRVFLSATVPAQPAQPSLLPPASAPQV
ncbi:MAG: KilA-N domain-containing protein, partial [Burkholderiaceae bacterium]|nr:KilA-N domain-containing protein [Burkholderiaceae bacterium]